MMTWLFISVGLLACGFLAAVISAAKAPMGYQDEAGFHYGPQETVEVEPGLVHSPA